MLFTFLESDTLLTQWLRALLFGLILFLFLFYLREKLSKHFHKLRGKFALNLLAESIHKTSLLFIAAISIYWGSQLLPLKPEIFRLIQRVMITLLMIQVGLWGNVWIAHLVELWRERYYDDLSMAKAASYLISLCLKIFLWIIVTLLLLENVGFEIKTMLAGLGIGGIAVALAIQSVLGDLLASFSIFLDQPFVIGDAVRVDEFQGKIEHIGLKTTRMRSIDGELIIFNNSDLLKSRLRNYKIVEEQRVIFSLQIPFDTEFQKIEKVPTLVRGIIQSFSGVRFDHVHFKEIGAYSSNFEVVYYLAGSESQTSREIQQAINYKILGALNQSGISLAYPTKKVINLESEKK